MDSETLSTDSEFGFTFGETDGITWMWDGDDGFKKVDPTFLDRLVDIATGDLDAEEASPKVREAMAYLREEGFIQEGLPVERYETPADVALWPRLLAFGLALVAAAVVAFLEYRSGTWRWGYIPGLRIQMLGMSVFFLAAVFHEFGHYFASRPYFDPSIRFGLLNGIFPALITRTDGAWMVPRNARLWITFAGPFMDLLTTVGLALVHWTLLPDSTLLSVLVLLLFARSLFVLNPLVDGDGYWLLVDGFGLVNLRSRGKSDLRERNPTWRAAYMVGSYAFTLALVTLLARGVANFFGLL